MQVLLCSPSVLAQERAPVRLRRGKRGTKTSLGVQQGAQGWVPGHRALQAGCAWSSGNAALPRFTLLPSCCRLSSNPLSHSPTPTATTHPHTHTHTLSHYHHIHTHIHTISPHAHPRTPHHHTTPTHTHSIPALHPPTHTQLSILRLFEAVLSDVAIRRSPPHADLLAFATRLVRSLFARWALPAC
jgi:hypothetical protein